MTDFPQVLFRGELKSFFWRFDDDRQLVFECFLFLGVCYKYVKWDKGFLLNAWWVCVEFYNEDVMDAAFTTAANVVCNEYETVWSIYEDKYR